MRRGLEEFPFVNRDIYTFDDGRRNGGGRRPSVRELYDHVFPEFVAAGWRWDIISHQKVLLPDGTIFRHPTLYFISPAATKTDTGGVIEILTVHGDEPGPITALAKTDNTNSLIEFGKHVPVFLFPLPNLGYLINKYMPWSPRKHLMRSVGDSQHLLPHNLHPTRPKLTQAVSQYATEFTRAILEVALKYQPWLSVNDHEDKDGSNRDMGIYVYSHGKLGERDPLAIELVKIASRHGFKVITNGETDRVTGHAKIVNGVVVVDDYSIDHALGSPRIQLNGQWRPGPSLFSVITPENSVMRKGQRIKLLDRVPFHEEIIQRLPEFYSTISAERKRYRST